MSDLVFFHQKINDRTPRRPLCVEALGWNRPLRPSAAAPQTRCRPAPWPELCRSSMAKSPLDGAGNAPSAGPLKIQRLPPSKWQFFTKNDLISMGGMGFLRFRWNTKNDMISSALWYFISEHPHLSTSSNRNIYGENHPLSSLRIRAAKKGLSDVFPQSWGFTMSWWYPQMDGWFHGQSQAAQWMTGDTPISGNLQQAQQRSHQSLRGWREQIFLWVSSEFWHQNSYGCLNASAMITKVFGPRHAMFGRDACRRCIH